MRVRYLCSEASTTWSRVPGEIYDLADAEAKGAIAAGKAEAVAEAPAPEEKEVKTAENATRNPRENASMPPSRGRNG